MSKELFQRIQKNSQYLIDNYPKSEALLRSAMQEAMPWAMRLYTKGVIPPLPQLERLATQLIAILVASEPVSPTTAEILRELKW